MNWRLFIALLITNLSFSQTEVGVVFEELPSDTVLPLSVSSHSSILPFVRFEKNTQSKFSKSISLKNSKSLIISPLIDLGGLINNNLSFRTGLGATLTSNFNSKLFFRISAIQGLGESEKKEFQPKSFIVNNEEGNRFNYTDIRGRISYTPNKIFNFQTGVDNNFIGEGNRSMLLSDFGKPYPFAQIRTNFWRVEYMILYQFFTENASNNTLKSKYGSTHVLSYNVTKWLNISAFESVVFMPKDTTLNRGFDAEYLNPIIFFRPQEYALGSSDNTFLGLQLSVKYKKHTLYGQVVIDDFDLHEMISGNKWWANKFGGQVGIKGKAISKNTNLFYRVEVNIAKPYMYSHASSSQNYGNKGSVLAHPYGGNFYEILGEIKWQKKKWLFKAFVNYHLYGADFTDSISYGGNIYASYNSHPNQYHNYIGQGIKTNGIKFMFSAAYLIDKSSNLQVFIENHFQGNTYYNIPGYQLVVGLRSCLWNDYRNY